MIQILSVLIPLVGLSVVIPVIQRKCTSKQLRWLIFGMFGVYILGNLYFTLFSRTLDSVRHLELQPFRTYGRLFEESVVESTATGFAALFLENTLPITGFVLNILLYYPFGYFLPILFPKLKLRYVILIGCLCSIVTEITQYILKMGWCEMDDVIHNTVGTGIGLGVWWFQFKRKGKRDT